jgi:hypothetical protein
VLAFWQPMPWYAGEGLGVGEVLDVRALATSSLRDEIQIVDGRPRDYGGMTYLEADYARPRDPEEFVQILPSNDPLRVLRLASMGPEWETPASTPGEAGQLFARLPLSRYVQFAVDKALRRFDPQKTVAAHYRRGDVLPALAAARADFAEDMAQGEARFEDCTRHFLLRCSPLQAYAETLRPMVDQGFNVLFCSDAPEAATGFKQQFGSQLITAESLLGSMQLTPLQRALCDLILLARCTRIVGTQSIFSHGAAMIGGGEVLDVRSACTPDAVLGEYLEMVDFHRQTAAVRAGIKGVILRQLEETRIMASWNLEREQVGALLDATPPSKSRVQGRP